MKAANLPGSASAGWLIGGVLLLSALVLALANLHALGGIGSLAAALSQHTPPIEALQLAYGWLPRLVVCLLAGAGLAAAGTVMQQVLRNPIASPLTLGVAAGAQLALSIAMLLAPGMMGVIAEPVAMLGGSAALALVFGLTWHRFDPLTVVLAGLVVSLYFGAINGGLLLFFEYDISGLLIWGGGALTQHDWGEVLFLLPRLGMAIVLLALLVRPLAVLTLDDTSAQSLGLTLARTRVLCLGVAVYLTATIISAVGVIGFVGLIAPALARLLGARTLQQRLFWAPLLGGVMLLLTDQLVQQLSRQFFGLLPTGAFTALIGAPLLLWLLREVRPAVTPIQGAPTAYAERSRAPRLYLVWLLGAGSVLLALMLGRDAEVWRLGWSLVDLHFTLPRVLAAACAGLLLGLAGTLLQRVMRNPMASPEVLGVSGGALAGVVAMLYFWPVATYPSLVAAGTVGALATVGALMLFARRSGFAPERLLLAGIAIKAIYDGLIALVAASGTPFWQRLLNWISGSTYGADWSTIASGAIIAAIALPLVLVLSRWLELLTLGGEQAQSRGLDVVRARLVLLMLAALTTAAATLLVGPLSFVGLMAPHLARMLGMRRARTQILGACGAGVVLMVLADWMGRTLLTPYEVPAGIVASMIGGLYFMWLLRRV